ncbi:MAG TPA: hypothetical protein VM184_00505 [Gaiellaceae bacterium]|nr:hypothetical protein [Gaiellaceae bacterium]
MSPFRLLLAVASGAPPPTLGPYRLAGAALAACSLLCAGCGSGTPAGGDPRGERLEQLSGDPVFASVPEGATAVETEEQPARYRKPGFTGGGWDGPTVVVTFTSAAPPAEIYGFYARRAEAAGWRPTASGALGLTDRWAKTYPDEAPATLVLAVVEETTPERVYRLSGGIAPVTG